MIIFHFILFNSIYFYYYLIKLKIDFSKENHSTQWNQSPELQCYIYIYRKTLQQ